MHLQKHLKKKKKNRKHIQERFEHFRRHSYNAKKIQYFSTKQILLESKIKTTTFLKSLKKKKTQHIPQITKQKTQWHFKDTKTWKQQN